MKRIKLLHAADLHLDSPFEGLTGSKAAQRRREQRELLRSLMELAKTEEVQLVLLSGDLLDSASPYLETSEELLRALGSVSVPVFIAPGNHDPYTPGSPYAKLSFPENVHIFKSNRIECVELPELNARVFGAAFTERHSASMLAGFEPPADDGMLNLMCIHGELSQDSDYDPISETQLMRSGMDYVALGHIHKGRGLRKAGKTAYAWPGCTEGRGFDETGEKNVYIVGINGDECRIKPVCIAKRRYEILNVAASDDALSAINAVLPKDTENDVYRIVLSGESAESPDLRALYDALSGRFFALQLKDRTRPKVGVWDSAGEDSLRGQFLLRLKSAYDAAADDGERERIMQAARWGLAALCNREEVVCHDNK